MHGAVVLLTAATASLHTLEVLTSFSLLSPLSGSFLLAVPLLGQELLNLKR